MPTVISLTTAEHGGTSPSCGTGDHSSCGPDCGCGCPYTGMIERGRVESIAAIEARYPEQWIALVIPPGEDEMTPETAMLVAYGTDPDDVWDAVARITFNQVVHVYYNGSLERYLAWAEAA